MVNLHLLTQHVIPKLYPQNGDRSVTIDSVTSFHRVYTYRTERDLKRTRRLVSAQQKNLRKQLTRDKY